MAQIVNNDLVTTYDALWEDAIAQIRQQGVQTDPHLHNQANDTRRGLTLIARPSPDVCARVLDFLHEIEEIIPGQHTYMLESLHLTVLSLVSASAQARLDREQISTYRNAVESVLQRAHPLTVRFQGITASSSGVLIQGFPEADALNSLRDALRAAVRAAGMGDSLDVRYRLTTAHMTVLRFMRQPDNPYTLIESLRAYRRHDFGVTQVDTLHLVKSDWYMSPGRVEVLAAYDLT